MDFKAIKAFRKQKGLNQEQLGKLCGVRKSTVSEWESGKARPSGSAALLLETYVSGDRCVVPLTDKEERLLDEGVQRGNFKSREEFLATCLVHLIREGELPRIPRLTGER